MSTVAENPNADLKDVRLPDAASPFPAKEYIPGSGGSWVYNLSALGIAEMGGMSMFQLAHLNQTPEHPFRQMVEVDCSQKCGAKVTCMRMFASMTGCDECRNKAIERDRLKQTKAFWESICPDDLRTTDINHKDFPKLQYQATKDYAGKESLLLFGPTRSGKTRLATLLLKRCLVRYGLHVGFLWPEELTDIKHARDGLKQLHHYGKFDVLLMDDSLLTGAQDDRVSGWLKDLIDYRMRYGRHCIITSQVGSADYKEQQEKFGKDKVTKADKERVEALLARVREICRVVSFPPRDTVQDTVDY